MKAVNSSHRLQYTSLLLVAVMLSACTVITDFDESRLKISLDDILTAGNISLRLDSATDIGVLTLRFSEAFMGNDRVQLEQMIGTNLNVILADDSDRPDVEITRNRVTDTPAQAGDFQVVMGGGGKAVAISFVNPPANNFLLSSGDTVTIILDVAENTILDDGVFAWEITAN